jgi:hypothetical protein
MFNFPESIQVGPLSSLQFQQPCFEVRQLVRCLDHPGVQFLHPLRFEDPNLVVNTPLKTAFQQLGYLLERPKRQIVFYISVCGINLVPEVCNLVVKLIHEFLSLSDRVLQGLLGRRIHFNLRNGKFELGLLRTDAFYARIDPI